MDEQEIRVFLENPAHIASLLPSTITIDGLLARGGQGMVYKGFVAKTEAAIKVYFPGQVQLRVERETDALLKLNNPHIVKMLWKDSLLIGDIALPAVATSLIPGITLWQVIRQGKLNHNEISMIAYDIADAIAAMWSHPHRIVHRDLKPANIMITPERRACVIDLGVARHINRTPLTTIGSTWGTEGYMSPEQSSALKQLTCKSDVFALGIILVECALGRHPSRNDQASLLAMDLYKNLPFEINNWQYVELLRKMLHPRATKRPLPEEILDELKGFAEI
jgi:serine/threonine-protein kinase